MQDSFRDTFRPLPVQGLREVDGPGTTRIKMVPLLGIFRTASECGGMEQCPTVKTRPDKAASLRCS